MRAEFYGLVLETSAITVYLHSPWRATALEHRIFEAIRQLPNIQADRQGEEMLLSISDSKAWKATLQTVARVLKGWQEDAEPGSEKRLWRWFFEGDTDTDGYDRHGEPNSLWAYLRILIDRSSPEESEKSEDMELEEFSIRIYPDK